MIHCALNRTTDKGRRVEEWMGGERDFGMIVMRLLSAGGGSAEGLLYAGLDAKH